MALATRSSLYDVEVFPTTNTDVAGWEMMGNLQTKGFCVVNPNLSEEAIQKAIADIEELSAAGRLVQPPEQVVDGLLGSEGSAKTLSLDQLDPEDGSKGENLKVVDQQMTETAALIQDMLPDLGFDYLSRTYASVHETGMPGEDPQQLTEDDAATWLNIFIRARIMVIFCLGPIKGTLELKPFDDEAEAFEVPTIPGSIIMLRCDMMSHKHFALSKAHLMTCFLCDAAPSSKKDTSKPSRVPIVQELERWAITRLKELKEEETITGNVVSDLPPGWSAKMNHMFHAEQRCAVRGVAGRFCSAWQLSPWYSAGLPGTDFVTEVPLKRWDQSTGYDPDPESWKQGKSVLRHGSFADGLELFDCRFFSLSPAESGGMDPHQRQVLEVGYEACNRAGYKKGKLMNSRGGVYLGSGATIFGMVAEVSGATGGAASINSNRFSFCLGMKGPSMTIDTEGASSLSAIHLGADAVLDKGRGVANDFSLAGGVHWILGNVWWPQQQAAGMLSKTGRCLSFDATADGSVFGDGCGFTVLKRLTENVNGEQIWIDGQNLDGIIASSVMSSNGLNATMNAPSGAAEQEMVAECLRNAHLSPECVDAVECDSKGGLMADAVEVNALLRVLRGEDHEASLGVTSVKSRMGFGIENSGVASFLRVLMSNKYGTMTPNNHLYQINPYMECENKVNYMDEAVEFSMYNMYTGVTSKGFGGTNVHTVLFGESMFSAAERAAADEALEETGVREQMLPLFWPGGGGELEDEQIPVRGYSIAGTFTGWKPAAMEAEGTGTYGYTVTLGENRWEEFHVLLDGDARKCLHPGVPKGPKTSRVNGPEKSNRALSWRIDGCMDYFEVDRSGADAESGTSLQVATGGAGKYYELAKPDTGAAGDKYRVQLKIAGKFRTVTWEKLSEQADPSEVPLGSYSVVSNWNGWTFEQMAQEGQTWTYEVHLQRHGGDFQIVRNEDWGQVISPSKPRSDASELGFGPDEGLAARGFNWFLNGAPGDVFRITLVKDKTSEFGVPDLAVNKVSWEKLRTQELTKEQSKAAHQPRFSAVGTWNGFVVQNEVRLDSVTPGSSSQYSFFLKIGPDAQESFQLLQDLDWSWIVHPNRYVSATGTPHSVLTSYNDGGALDLVWTIGPDDEATSGEIFQVIITAMQSRVVSVSWIRAPGGPELENAARQGLILGS